MALTLCSLMTAIHMGYGLIAVKVKIWIDKKTALFNKLIALIFFLFFFINQLDTMKYSAVLRKH